MTTPEAKTVERKPLDAAAYSVLAITDLLPPEERLPGNHADYFPRVKLCIESIIRRYGQWKAMNARGDCLTAGKDTQEGEDVRRCMLAELRMSLVGVKTTQNHRKTIRDAMVKLGRKVDRSVWLAVVADIDFDKPFDLRKRVENLKG